MITRDKLDGPMWSSNIYEDADFNDDDDEDDVDEDAADDDVKQGGGQSVAA